MQTCRRAWGADETISLKPRPANLTTLTQASLSQPEEKSLVLVVDVEFDFHEHTATLSIVEGNRCRVFKMRILGRSNLIDPVVPRQIHLSSRLYNHNANLTDM